MELSRWNSLKYFEITLDNVSQLYMVVKNMNGYITNISTAPDNDITWQSNPTYNVLYSKTGNTHIADQLIKLANLFERGLLTLTEYQLAKAQLI